MKQRRCLMGAPALFIVAIACGLPLVWTSTIIITHPHSIFDLWLSPFRFKLLGFTFACNALVGVVAVGLGFPAGWVMGRNPGWPGKIMWTLASATLLLPFLAFGHGWNQAFRITAPFWKSMGITFSPGGLNDTARCIWTLACWLWGIPAIIVGLALRRLDPDIQAAAWLDGALHRTTFRALAGPLLAATAAAMMLATQEFAVYEPTGVQVVATEVRMVFATGAFSSASESGANQEERAAAAAVTAMPLLLGTALLALVAFKAAGRFSFGTTIHIKDWPPILNTPRFINLLAGVLVLLTLGVPVASLLASLKTLDSPAVLFDEFGDALLGSGFLFLAVTALAGIIAFSASAFWARGLLTASCLSFLLGGEIVAVALIRIFNRPAFEWLYDSWPLPVIAYLARFTCIALFAARSTWSPTWQHIRIQAAHDGAGPLAAAVRIIWPLAWPGFAAAALLVGILSFGEVDATGTLVPQHPSVLTTRLLAMANATRSNRMVEGSLISIGIVAFCFLLFLLSHCVWRFSLAALKSIETPSD